MDRVELELPNIHKFDEKRLLIVVDLRTQSFDPVEWYEIERYIRRMNPLQIHEVDAKPVVIKDILCEADLNGFIAGGDTPRAVDIIRRLENRHWGRLINGWSCAVNRWQTIWM